MKITDIPHIYANLTRTAEIVAVLSRYGLSEWLHRLNLDLSLLPIPYKAQIKDLAQRTFGERLRLALEELGPCFIKLGQILSTRADLVSQDVLEELRKLQSGTEADDPEWVEKHLIEVLGAERFAQFKEISMSPMASASIGQVHSAVLQDGTEVVIKVRHQDIVPVIDKDLEIVAALASLASRSPELAVYDPKGIVEEFGNTLRHELDFRRELRNLQKFSANFSEADDVHIPLCYPELSGETVLTMERLNGVTLAQMTQGSCSPEVLVHLAKRGAEIFLDMIFDHGLFHADPHPGNFIIVEQKIIGLIDFGMVGYLDENLREEIENMLMALMHNDADLLTSILLRIGHVPNDIDRSRMMRDVREFASYYGSMAVSELPLGKVLEDLLKIIRRYHISLPTQAAMLIKVLIMLEGTSHLLNPNFSMFEIMKPLQGKILKRRLSPERNLKRLRRFQDQLEHALTTVPGQVVDIVGKVQKGDINVNLNHKGLSASVNRLVLALIASALFLGGSFMLSLKVHPLLFTRPMYGLHNMSLFGVLAIFASMYLVFRLLLAIRSSGRL